MHRILILTGTLSRSTGKGHLKMSGHLDHTLDPVETLMTEITRTIDPLLTETTTTLTEKTHIVDPLSTGIPTIIAAETPRTGIISPITIGTQPTGITVKNNGAPSTVGAPIPHLTAKS